MLNKAIIDLKLLKQNALCVKNKLNKGVKLCAVVKADAYGHGAEEVANALYSIADCFAVALLEEGIKLRQSSIDKEIICLIPFSVTETDSAVFYDITATVTDKKQVLALSKSAKKQGKLARVHVKFNTGMNRQGIDDLCELDDLLSFINKTEGVILCGLYSHFYAPENKNALSLQLNKFLLANNLIKGYNNSVTCHISASGGFLAGVQTDMVRIGLLLYGYKPMDSSLVDVSPVMKIYAPIVERRVLEKGECALYGGKVTKKQTDLTLIRYGYADGLFRKETEYEFNNRCMDLTAVIGDVGEKTLYTVMENADILAKRYGTISYEILTKSALRAEKIYLR